MLRTMSLPLLLVLLTTTLTLAQSAPTLAPSTDRAAWWREARFGMFIHWGVYSVPADATNLKGELGAAEWYLTNKQAQIADYEKFAAQFNPTKFDAAAWVRIAKDAGMKYIVITSKHHDGFCLFDTQLTDWCITKATPFKRDPLKELADECRKQGIRLCFYHSIMDWHHPDYLPRRSWEKDTRPATGADFDRYVAYMKGQLKELLTNYGPIGVLWFDGEWEDTWTHARGADLYDYVRGLQPDILINNRVDKGRAQGGITAGGDFRGDFGTPEQEIPGTGFADGRLWESCMTINNTWGYATNDHDWKSSETLIRHLCDIAHKGGNFLLNVGPTATGEFPPEITQRLADMGAWLKHNGPAIYGTSPSPFKRLSFDGRCTRKGDTLYLHVFHWPTGGLVLTGLQTAVKSARALADGQTLEVQALPDQPNAWQIGKPTTLDAVATVVELTLAGPPVVVVSALRPDKDGMFTLKAADADVHGHAARYERGAGKDNIGYWTNPADYVTWDIEVAAAGPYAVELTYACPPESDGSTYTVSAEGTSTATSAPEGTVKSTGSWTQFETVKLGQLTLAAGKQALAVRIKALPKGAAMNLQQVRLTPAKP